jgi:hypothetical protein
MAVIARAKAARVKPLRTSHPPPGRAGDEGEGEMSECYVSKNRKIRWTPEEDELLRKLVVANVPVSEIATELGRSMSSVKARAHALRIALGRYVLK